MLGTVIASIPSPGVSSISLGPLYLRAYGLMIALGVIAAVQLANRRWTARGGDPEQITLIALWAVPAGLVGSRAYHVLTDWKRFHYDNGWLDAFAIWKGGLGIPGGMAAGILVGLWAARRMQINRAAAIDAIAPSLPLAQAIGRFGNWFNQELFGSPTDLPWGLEIDRAHRPAEHLASETFHPTFLYESLWNLTLCAVLVAVDRRRVLKPGSLLAVYIGGYGLGRLWIELLRVDPASLLAGVRVNVWMSLALISGSILWLAWPRLRPHAASPSDPSDDGVVVVASDPDDGVVVVASDPDDGVVVVASDPDDGVVVVASDPDVPQSD